MDEKNKAFSISYSGATKDELDHYKKKYTQQEPSKNIKRIRYIDKKIDSVSAIISICCGLIGTEMLVFGGILIFKGETSLLLCGILILLGALIDSLVPFFHFKIHALIKKHYSPIILDLIKDLEEKQL